MKRATLGECVLDAAHTATLPCAESAASERSSKGVYGYVVKAVPWRSCTAVLVG